MQYLQIIFILSVYKYFLVFVWTFFSLTLEIAVSRAKKCWIMFLSLFKILTDFFNKYLSLFSSNFCTAFCIYLCHFSLFYMLLINHDAVWSGVTTHRCTWSRSTHLCDFFLPLLNNLMWCVIFSIRLHCPYCWCLQFFFFCTFQFLLCYHLLDFHTYTLN